LLIAHRTPLAETADELVQAPIPHVRSKVEWQEPPGGLQATIRRPADRADRRHSDASQRQKGQSDAQLQSPNPRNRRWHSHSTLSSRTAMKLAWTSAIGARLTGSPPHSAASPRMFMQQSLR